MHRILGLNVVVLVITKLMKCEIYPSLLSEQNVNKAVNVARRYNDSEAKEYTANEETFESGHHRNQVESVTPITARSERFSATDTDNHATASIYAPHSRRDPRQRDFPNNNPKQSTPTGLHGTWPTYSTETGQTETLSAIAVKTWSSSNRSESTNSEQEQQQLQQQQANKSTKESVPVAESSSNVDANEMISVFKYFFDDLPTAENVTNNGASIASNQEAVSSGAPQTTDGNVASSTGSQATPNNTEVSRTSPVPTVHPTPSRERNSTPPFDKREPTFFERSDQSSSGDSANTVPLISSQSSYASATTTITTTTTTTTIATPANLLIGDTESVAQLRSIPTRYEGSSSSEENRGSGSIPRTFQVDLIPAGSRSSRFLQLLLIPFYIVIGSCLIMCFFCMVHVYIHSRFAR